MRALAERAGVHVGRVLKMDASRRSAHSNAYFTGIGRVKRVVLFDTLLAHMSHAEVLAVLSHELGHWKKHHVLVRMLAGYAVTLLGAYVAFLATRATFVPALVGLEQASLPARLVILAAAASVLTFPLTPFGSAWSRHDERAADLFAGRALRTARRPSRALPRQALRAKTSRTSTRTRCTRNSTTAIRPSRSASGACRACWARVRRPPPA